MDHQQKPFRVVINQHVSLAKVVLSRQMRGEMTPSEAILWERLRCSALGVNFRRQQIIDGFIADFYCHSEALAVEVDGPIHNPEYDQQRDQIFAKRGIRVLRVTNNDVQTNIESTMYRIRNELANTPPSTEPTSS